MKNLYSELISPEDYLVLKDFGNGTTFEVTLMPFKEARENVNIKSNYKYWFNDYRVTRYNSHGLFPYDPTTDIDEFLKDKSRIIWAIVALTGSNKIYTAGMHIGNVSLQSINMFNRSAEIACVIGESEYWSKGIMTWACELIIRHGFRKLGLNRIWSGTSLLNIGMRKVFDKLGFKLEGCFREGQFLNGKFRDVLVYGLLKSDKLKRKDDISDEEFPAGDGAYVHKPDTENKNKEDERLINKMQKIRAKNNINWMDLVRLAFKGDRERAKMIMAAIEFQDSEIGEVSKELSKTNYSFDVQ